MSSRLYHFRWVALSAVAFTVGCQHQSTPPQLVVHLSSATPVGFSGTLWVDGKEQPLSGTTPVEIELQAHEVKYHLVQSAENGTLTVEVREAHHPQLLSHVGASTGPNTVAHDSVSFD